MAVSAEIMQSAEQACGLDLSALPLGTPVVATYSRHRATPGEGYRCLIAGLTATGSLKAWVEKLNPTDVVQNTERVLAPEISAYIKQADTNYTYSGRHEEYVVRCSRMVKLFVDGTHAAVLIE